MAGAISVQRGVIIFTKKMDGHTLFPSMGRMKLVLEWKRKLLKKWG